MKRLIFIFIILAFGIINSKAQPNGGFENWLFEFGYENPANWQTLNFLSITFPANPLSAFKATGIDKHSGNYALQVKTIYLNNNPTPGRLDDTIGRVFTGKVTISPPSIHYGIPFTGRPEKLEFWCKYTPVGIDTGGAIVVLQRWNGNGQDTIAIGFVKIKATPSYSPFQINLTYYSTALPDTVIIAFASSKTKAQARVGSTLFLDDVAFTGWVGIDEPRAYGTNKVKVFPNPAKDDVTILAHIEDADNIRVTDALGRLAGNYIIRNYSVNINTDAFADGFYFYEIHDKKDRILAKGKFNVIK